MDAGRGAAWLSAARVTAGLGLAAAPGWAGRQLVGDAAEPAGARLFIAAFGARDVLLGAGVLTALRAHRAARP